MYSLNDLYLVSVSVALVPFIPTKYSLGITLDNPDTVMVTTPLELKEVGENEAVAPKGKSTAENVVVPEPVCV